MIGTSWDFIEDAIELLEKDDGAYALLISKPGFNRTDAFYNVNKDGAILFVRALKDAFAKKFPDEPEFKETP